MGTRPRPSDSGFRAFPITAPNAREGSLRIRCGASWIARRSPRDGSDGLPDSWREMLLDSPPRERRVVVRRIEGEEKTKGGIIIPDTAKEKPQEGEVIAVGPGARDESGKVVALELKAGDRVLFGKWSATEVRVDGEDLLIMKESDIMGVIEQSLAKKKAA